MAVFIVPCTLLLLLQGMLFCVFTSCMLNAMGGSCSQLCSTIDSRGQAHEAVPGKLRYNLCLFCKRKKVYRGKVTHFCVSCGNHVECNKNLPQHGLEHGRRNFLPVSLQKCMRCAQETRDSQKRLYTIFKELYKRKGHYILNTEQLDLKPITKTMLFNVT